MTCEHDRKERETAARGGICPLCLGIEVERLQKIEEAAQEVRKVVIATGDHTEWFAALAQMFQALDREGCSK